MEIGIGCTTCVPGLRSGGVSQVVDQELFKMGGARASGGQKSPSWVQQNAIIEYKFVRFPAQNFEFHKYRSTAWTLFLCIHN